jgi:predicted HAD superfamily hydrolase
LTLQVSLAVMSAMESLILSSPDDCAVMANLTNVGFAVLLPKNFRFAHSLFLQCLQGIYATENATTLKVEASYSISALIQSAYENYGFISNETVIAMRQHVILRVVQSIQVCNDRWGFPLS